MLLAFLVLCLGSVVLARGSLLALATVRFRGTGLVLGAFLLQVLVISAMPDAPEGVTSSLHLASYCLAGAFVYLNRHIPGLWLVGLGGGSNLLVISANEGVMPATRSALEVAGLAPSGPEFLNSAALGNPRLAFLGDIFAVPASWPVHNVFSFGDILIALGAALALHRICRSRLVPSGTGQFAALRYHKSFMRMWGSQALSNLGDWVYTLAVATSIAQRTGSTRALATVFVMQVAPAAVFGAFGGQLVDRLPRKRLMITADVVRALAVGSLLLFGTPSLPHLYGVAMVLGLFGAIFQPSLQASLPNVLPRERLVAANALVTGTFHTAITIGPLLGGFLMAGAGAVPAFWINALSFALSAVLLAGVHLPRQDAAAGSVRPLKDLAEGLSHMRSSALVRGIMAVTGLVLFATALRAPLEALFVFESLGSGAAGLGLVGGAWGLGMVLGSVAAPAVARRWPRERSLGAGVLVVGVCGLGASMAQVLPPVLVLWLISGVGNAVGTIAYESLLQERTPDRLRGRVLAASEAVLDVSFLLGVVVTAWIGAQLGVRTVYALSGGLFIAAAVLCHRLLGRRAEPVSTERAPGSVEAVSRTEASADQSTEAGAPRTWATTAE